MILISGMLSEEEFTSQGPHVEEHRSGGGPSISVVPLTEPEGRISPALLIFDNMWLFFWETYITGHLTGATHSSDCNCYKQVNYSLYALLTLLPFLGSIKE